MLQQDRPDSAYELLVTLEAELGNSAEYNYLLGVASLQTQHFSQARSAFERTILLEPTNAGAHLDLAITEIELKNYDEALARLEQIEREFTPPKGIRYLIARYRARIKDEQTPKSVFAGHLFASTGHTSNVNNGTDKSLIELDLGNGPVQLPVGDSSKSSPDHYQDYGLSASYSLSMGRWRHQLISAVQQRNHETFDEFDTVQLFIGSSSRINIDRHELEAGLYYSEVWLDGDDYQHAVSASLNHSYRLRNNVRLTHTLRAQQTRYLQTPSNNLDQLEASVIIGYPFSLLGTQNLIQLRGRLSNGNATNDRPGGDQTREQLQLSLISQPAPRHVLRLSGFIGNEADTTPYNNSLFGERIRDTDKRGIEASYSYYLSPALSLTLSGAALRNDSTIELFTTETDSLSLKLRYDF